MTGWESNLLLVLPLVLFVVVGLWAWSALDRWLQDALGRGEEDLG